MDRPSGDTGISPTWAEDPRKVVTVQGIDRRKGTCLQSMIHYP